MKSESKDQKKLKKFEALKEEIEHFIANEAMLHWHYIHDKEIIKVFSSYKKKHVKRALRELR